MRSEAALSELRFEKRRADVIVSLSSGDVVQGCIFTAGGVTGHEGPERVGDLLNADPRGFLPFEVRDGTGTRTVLINCAHVVTVSIADHEAALDAGYDVATRRFVSMTLSSSQRVTGTIRVYRPEGHERLSDWTHQPEVFRYLETADRTLLVNTNHIVEVSEVLEP
jgi:hypothetical protein